MAWIREFRNSIWEERVNTGALTVIMLLWGLHLAYPMSHLQNMRWTFLGYSVPIYYFLTLPAILGTAVAVIAFKRHWTRWELFWWGLPLMCLPGMLLSNDTLWSLRQWLSWVVRGVIPGGIIFLTIRRKDTATKLLCWIYPLIIATSLLGLTELFFQFNPLKVAGDAPIIATSQPSNPFYRPRETMEGSAPPQGTQGNRIAFVSILAAFLSVGVWFWQYAKKFRWIYFLAIAILFLILLLGQVRAAWVAIAPILLLLVIVGLKRKSWATLKIMAAGAFTVWALLIPERTNYMIMVRYNSFVLDEASFQLRLDILRTAKILKECWAFGVGFGQFPMEAKRYYQGVHPWIWTADNQYFRWIVENGVFSFLTLLLFFSGLGAAGWKKIRQMQDIEEADFYRSILLAWLTIALAFLFFDGFYWGACNMTFWCLLGLFATCLSIREFKHSVL